MEGFFEVNNLSIFYKEYILDNDKKTILFIHGWMDSLENYEVNLKGILKDYNVVIFDLPGHGNSEDLKNCRVSDYVKIVNEFKYCLGYEINFIVGHSLGAIIASYLIDCEIRVLIGIPDVKINKSRYVLIWFLSFLKAVYILQVFVWLIKNFSLFKLFWARLMISSKTFSKENLLTVKGIEATSVNAIIGGIFEILRNNFRINRNYKKIKTYFIVGENDPVSHTNIRFDNLFVIKGARHAPNRTHPNRFNNLLRRLLDK